MGMKISSFRGKKRQVISDINITPFVDVLLVLLIIFMVAAPMMTSGIDVELPKGANNFINEKEVPITIAIKADGSIFLHEEEVKLRALPNRLLEITSNNLDSKIYVKGDKNLDYGRVMEIVKVTSMAGFSQVVLVTEINANQ
jgi:biopolymer transport protein TolR